MFHVEFLVDDKHLVRMHLALHGLKLFNLDVQPVVNAKQDKGKVVEKNTATIGEQLMPALLKTFSILGATGRITRLQIFEVIRQLGGKPNSQQIQRLIKTKQLKRVGHALYTIVGKKR
jgi:hypothetical protein